MAKRLLPLLLTAALAGCVGGSGTLDESWSAKLVPPAATKDAPGIKPRTYDALEAARKQHDRIYKTRKELDDYAVVADLSLIGLAVAGTAAAVFGSPPGQLDLLQGIGIAAGGVTATRSYLNFSGRADQHNKALGASSCVLARGSVLAENTRLDQIQMLVATKALLDDAIILAEIALATTSGMTDAPAPLIEQARGGLAKSVSAGTDASGAAKLELDAMSEDATAIALAVMRIDEWLYSNARRGTVSADDIIATLKEKIKEASEVEAKRKQAEEKDKEGTANTAAAQTADKAQGPKPALAPAANRQLTNAKLALRAAFADSARPSSIEAARSTERSSPGDRALSDVLDRACSGAAIDNAQSSIDILRSSQVCLSAHTKRTLLRMLSVAKKQADLSECLFK